MNIAHTAKKLVRKIGLGLFMVVLSIPAFGASHRIDGNLFVVPESKLPAQTRNQGDAMTLYLADLHTLYLYIERDGGRNLAIFDVRDPGKIKFKRLVPINASSAFDFEQLVAPHSILVRYRDGSGEAILNLRDAKNPELRALSDASTETYIVPIGDGHPDGPSKEERNVVPRDYHFLTPNGQQSPLTIKSVIQQQVDTGNQTTYLLGSEGLTVIRNIRAEKNLATLAPPYTGTIDDN